MKRILILEDEEHLCELYRQVLEDEGYLVTTARDGDSALALLAAQPCDLAIVDIKLGRTNGLDYVRDMLALHRNMKIVLNTAYSMFKQDLRTWSADAYILKSSDYAELIATVNRLLRRRKTKART